MKIVALTITNLTQSIAKKLNTTLDTAQLEHFADGELHVTLTNPQQYANQTVLVIQSTARPVNELVLATAFLIHELQNAGAAKIIGLLPYFGYSRQEESTITAKPGNGTIVAQLVQNAGLNQLLVVELHASALMHFFEIPVTNIRMIDTIADHIKNSFSSFDDVCLVAPDEGAVSLVEGIAHKLGLINTITFTKQRYGKDKTRIIETKGSYRGHTAIIIDDIISTGSTAMHAAQHMRDQGFKNVYGYFVHPILAHGAHEIVQQNLFTKIFVTATIPLEHPLPSSIEIIDISAQLAQEINKILNIN